MATKIGLQNMIEERDVEISQIRAELTKRHQTIKHLENRISEIVQQANVNYRELLRVRSELTRYGALDNLDIVAMLHEAVNHKARRAKVDRDKSYAELEQQLITMRSERDRLASLLRKIHEESMFWAEVFQSTHPVPQFLKTIQDTQKCSDCSSVGEHFWYCVKFQHPLMATGAPANTNAKQSVQKQSDEKQPSSPGSSAFPRTDRD